MHESLSSTGVFHAFRLGPGENLTEGLRRIKIDDGCYEIDGTDGDGRRIEVTVHPATLDVLKVEFEDEAGHIRRDGPPGHD